MIWKALSLLSIRFNDFVQNVFVPVASYALSIALFLSIQMHIFI